MITGIVLENFKCFERVEIHPKRVTCFVGANGTGKSSVLQAFGLLKQSVEAVRNSSGINAIIMGCALKLSGPLVSVSKSNSLRGKSERDPIKLFFSGKEYLGQTDPNYSYSVEFNSNHLVRLPTMYQEVGAHTHSMLDKLRIVPALRGLTLPVYKLGNDVASDASMEVGLSKQEAQTVTNLGYSQDQTDGISKVLKRVTGVGLKSEIVPPQSVEVKSVSPTGPVNIVSEGFGTNALVMLLLQLTSAERGATIMIEEPEIHLHPRAQAELSEVLTEVALEEDKQVIMTTHSEHITGRLLTLVAEGKLTPDDVAIYAFEKDEEGVCTAKDLKISDDGRIEGSIGDFFEVNLAEMNRMVKALDSRTNQGG